MSISSQSLDSRAYLLTHVFPALTPLAVGPSHPVPHVREGSLAIAVIIDGKTRDGEPPFAIIELPAALDEMASQIAAHVDDLFPGFRVKERAIFRIGYDHRLQIDPSASAPMSERIVEMLSRR